MAQIQMPEKNQTNEMPSQKQLTKIVQGEVKVKRPGVDKKLRDIFISEDADSVGDYLVWGVIVPAIRGMLRDAGHGIVDGVFGKGGRFRGGYEPERRSYERSGYYSRSNYASHYKYDRDDRPYGRSFRYSSRDTEIIFDSRAEAEEVRDTLCEVIDRYGSASINDLNDMIGIDMADRRSGDSDWGWYDISRSRIRSTREGYVLELPSPERI